MLWALGYIENIDYPDHICDVPKACAFLREVDSFQEFLKNSKLKNKDQILDEADLIYRYDWACSYQGRKSPRQS